MCVFTCHTIDTEPTRVVNEVFEKFSMAVVMFGEGLR
jgi:hypothetical protein